MFSNPHNTHTYYGSIAKFFHWTTALLILTLIPLGIYANDLPIEGGEALARKAWYFSLHKTLGVTAFFIALARITWAVVQTKPRGLHPERRLETVAAETVHWLLYGSLVVVPLSGWVHHAASAGFAPIWWPLGQNLPLVPKSETLAGIATGLHIVFERVLVLSIILHIAGALKHRLIDRDATLARMLPRTPRLAEIKPAHRTYLPLVAAAGVWAMAVSVGAGLGVYGGHGHGGTHTQTLAAVQSDWTVKTGSIAITVTQFGSAVTGEFGDWTASITYDPALGQGAVEAAINAGSLVLGSVTDQALGDDFMAAGAFPVATFTGQITKDTGHQVAGTLTLKNIAIDVAFPFDLEIIGKDATMSGTAVLDRRDFGIGASVNDAATLGFEVAVQITLTATQND